MATSAGIPCESCGREEPESDLAAVRRVYVTPADWDTEERIDIVDELERWCFSCRGTYPHQLAAGDILEL